LKVPRINNNIRYICLRITVDGIPKETSIGSKEDAKIINFFLGTMEAKINKYKNDLVYAEHSISSQKILDFILGRIAPKIKVFEKFLKHNDELLALVCKEEYVMGGIDNENVGINVNHTIIY